GQRGSLLQRAPGPVQLGPELADDALALAAQLAHAIQEQQLRGSGALGAVEQDVVVAGRRDRESLAQRGQERLARLGKQAGIRCVLAAEFGLCRTHAHGLRHGCGETVRRWAAPSSRLRIVRPAARRNRDQVGTSLLPLRNFNSLRRVFLRAVLTNTLGAACTKPVGSVIRQPGAEAPLAYNQ